MYSMRWTWLSCSRLPWPPTAAVLFTDVRIGWLSVALEVLGSMSAARAAPDGGPGADAPFYANAAGKMPSAGCHDPKHNFGPPNDAPVQRGGDGHRAGLRAVPSLKYSQNTPPFTAHFIDDEGDDSVDQGPAGGRTWDGRAQSYHAQARLPLFSPFEMANPDSDAVIAKVQAGHDTQFRAVFGEKVFDDK